MLICIINQFQNNTVIFSNCIIRMIGYHISYHETIHFLVSNFLQFSKIISSRRSKINNSSIKVVKKLFKSKWCNHICKMQPIVVGFPVRGRCDVKMVMNAVSFLLSCVVNNVCYLSIMDKCLNVHVELDQACKMIFVKWKPFFFSPLIFIWVVFVVVYHARCKK